MKTKRRMLRYFLKWVIGLLFSFAGLFLLVMVLFYMPPVQRYAIKKTTDILAESTGVDVKIGHLRLAFFFDLSLREVNVMDAMQDTLLSVERLDIDLDFTSLLRGEVSVDGIELQQAALNSKEYIPAVNIEGSLAYFFIDSHGISFPRGKAVVNHAFLNGADLSVQLKTKATEKDTASLNFPWQFNLETLLLADSKVSVTLPDDSLQMALALDSLLVEDATADLSKFDFGIEEVLLSADTLSYDKMYTTHEKGFDINHIGIFGMHAHLKTLHFNATAMSASMQLSEFRFKESSGWQVTESSGMFFMDSLRAELPQIYIRTDHSMLEMHANADFAAFGNGDEGWLEVEVEGTFGKKDVMRLLPDVSGELRNGYPNKPIRITVDADGNFSRMYLRSSEISMPGAFQLNAEGELHGLYNPELMSGNLSLAAQTHDVNFLTALMSSDSSELTFPPLTFEGDLVMKGPEYSAEMQLCEDSAVVSVNAYFDSRKMAYEASLSVSDLQMQHFFPKDSLYGVSFKGSVSGTGTDFYNKKTHLQAALDLEKLEYAAYDFGGVHLQAALQDGFGNVQVTSRNDLLALSSQVDAMIVPSNTELTFSVDLEKMDLQALHVTERPFAIGMCLHVDGSTNLRDRYVVNGGVSDMLFMTQDTVYRSKEIQMQLLAHTDTTSLRLETGDFFLDFKSENGYEEILGRMTHMFTMMEAQFDRRVLAQDSLVSVLPVMHLQLRSGGDNPISNSLSMMGYSLEQLHLSLNTNPTLGINGGGQLLGANLNGIALDTIQSHIYQDSVGVKFDMRVCNGPKNKQFIFDSRLLAYLTSDGAGLDVHYHDEHGDTGVDVGVKVMMAEEGLRATFSNPHPIVAYRHFDINTNNYIYLKRDNQVEADVEMEADDGTRVKIYSTPNDEALQDLTFSLQQLNLGELMSVIPYAPRLTGFLLMDLHLVQTLENLSIAMDAVVDDMAYEGAPMGDMGCTAVYLPHSKGMHYVDAHITNNEKKVIALFGTYQSDDGSEFLDAEMELLDFPLAMMNGFMTGQPLSIDGLANGVLQVEGKTDTPMLNGWLSLAETKILSPEYSLNLTLEDDSIKLVNSKLNFNRLNVYSTGKNPMVFDGTVDFSDFGKVLLDLRVNADNFELINAKRTKQSAAYGKVYVNLGARVTGDFNEMRVGGRLNVLGNTDVTYILRDSPLTVEDRLSDLVTFVDFAETEVKNEKKQGQTMNMNLTMQIAIDQAAQIHCLLSEDRSKYIDLEGGGELTMNYTPQGDLTLNGRYTVISGEMKYSLPVIPLKTFTLASGSYVDFKGPVLNPTLNLSATERVRTTVTENDVPRSVNFDVGLTITQTLENMGLEFTLVAPEDLTVQNQLASMSLEQRGRLAVTMLATGMYLADSNLEGFSTTNALNALLQSEISNIAGKALQTIDISVGMDTETSVSGAERTDYSFRFAKRLWGNRVSIIVGGKVSTGDDVDNVGQSLIDNISIEYRLDKSATRYVSVFYDRNYESLLEGEVMEMGAGLVLRKKMARLGELFIFKNENKKKKNQAVNEKKGN